MSKERADVLKLMNFILMKIVVLLSDIVGFVFIGGVVQRLEEGMGAAAGRAVACLWAGGLRPDPVSCG